MVVLRCTDDGTPEVLLGRRKKDFGFGKWSLPGGHLEYRESWSGCAARELLEEAGLDCTGEQARFLGATNDIEGVHHYVTIYVGFNVDIDAEPENREPEKCEGWEWFDLAALEYGIANKDSALADLWEPLKELFGSEFAQREMCSLAPPF